MKICSNKNCVFAGQLQPLENFYKYSNKRKSQYQSECKACVIRKNSIYYEENKEEVKKKRKVRRDLHKEEKREYDKKRRVDLKDIIKLKKHIYYQLHKDKINQKLREKRKKDIQFKIAANLRKRQYNVIKNSCKSGSAVRDLGISIFDFKKYLEERFYSNPDTGETMSWDNYGRPNGKMGWDIDHIIPLCAFDLTNRKQFLKACNYTNLRPMWAKQNMFENDRGMSRRKGKNNGK